MARRLVFFTLAACLAGAFGWSKPQDNDRYTRLARLSLIEGNVSFQHSSDADWSAAAINLPLEPGDRIYTGNDGRAEIQFEDGSVFRLAENTDVEFLSLDEDLIQIRLLIGLSTLTVSGDADFEINTPAAAFNAVRDGVYRFDVVEDGDTDAIVRKGELEAANNRFTRRIHAGELMHLPAGGNSTPQMSEYDRRDAWDEWNDRRTADTRVYGNVRYIPDTVSMGSSDLYRYGRWVNVDTYGTAWIPSGIDDYWSPYSMGRWVYRPFYGWTWVSYEPWGWLPYHYGRWYRSSIYGWCWLPGPSFSFNFWSPALVTFYSGPGWVSWCPLGPGDYYEINNYHYRRGIYSHQLDELRRLHTRRPGDPFNRDVRGAFRTAEMNDFRNGVFDSRGKNGRWGNISRPWDQGSLVRDRLDIKPTSRSFSAAPDRTAAKPRGSSAMPSIVRTVPRRDSVDRRQLTRIENPQVPAFQPRTRARGESGDNPVNMRGRGTDPDGRTIQVPRRPVESSPGEQNERRTTPNSRWGSGSQRNGDGANRGGRDSTPPPPRNSAPSTQQSPSRNEEQRSAPEQRNNQQSAPEQRRGRERQENSAGYARPGVGRWSESNPGSTRSTGKAQVYSAPRSEMRPDTRGTWSNSSPGSSRSYNSPRYEGGRAGMSRPPSSGAPSYSAPSGRSGGGRQYSPAPSAPSNNSGGGRWSSGRGASDGGSSRGGNGGGGRPRR